MNIFVIVLKTIITTIDAMLTIAVIKANETNEGMKKFFLLLVLMNLAGVWI